MDSVFRDERIADADGEPAAPGWHAPVLRVYEMSGAAGDPTISDDGLAAGQFS